MFNLGYLPGGDPTVITQPSSTLTALDAAMRLLKPGGIITAVLYPGHDGGDAEADAVRDWACRLPRRAAHVISYRPLNHHARAPYLVAVEKR
jgi:glyoxylase-like metal-dependent hydrolase (beta-lactamase superfamily II)